MTRSSVKGRDHDAKMQDSSDMIPFRDTSRVFFSFLQRSPRPVIGRGRPTPPLNGRVSARKESAVKPGSVVDSHSSGMRVAAQL